MNKISLKITENVKKKIDELKKKYKQTDDGLVELFFIYGLPVVVNGFKKAKIELETINNLFEIGDSFVLDVSLSEVLFKQLGEYKGGSISNLFFLCYANSSYIVEDRLKIVWQRWEFDFEEVLCEEVIEEYLEEKLCKKQKS